MGLRPGLPDYVFIGPDGVFFLEMKRARRGRSSDDQSDLAQHCLACGIDYVVARGVREALVELKRRGIVRAEVTA
jgi:predicted type IV restriction endonuclease